MLKAHLLDVLLSFKAGELLQEDPDLFREWRRLLGQSKSRSRAR